MFCLLAPGAFAANLVFNGSFETRSPTPLVVQSLNSAAGWISAGGSPDFFDGTGINYGYGPQTAFDGVGFAGILNSPPTVGGVNQTIQYEYLQTQLICELLPGMVYTLSLRVNLSDIAYRATDGLGMHLSADQSGNRPTGPSFLPITLTPSVANPTGNYITDKTNWVLFQGTYTAVGGERYLTIGNFSQSLALAIPPPSSGGWADFGYFFIDDVRVEGEVDCVPEPGSVFLTASAGLAGLILARHRKRVSAKAG